MEHYNKLRKLFSSNKAEFTIKASKIHNFKYNYDKVLYINNKTKVIIICNKHGEFTQRPDNHINLKHGCPECKKLIQSLRQTKDIKDFIKDANKIYKNKYDYTNVIYIRNNKPILINCTKHGLFKQRPNDHLSGKEGCKKCSNSGVFKLEKEVANYVKTLVEIVENDKKILNGLELDIYIPSLQKAIEVNGKYWHYYNNKARFNNYHASKSNLCKLKGIMLLHIREDLWVNNKNKMKQVIVDFLKLN